MIIEDGVKRHDELRLQMDKSPIVQKVGNMIQHHKEQMNTAHIQEKSNVFEVTVPVNNTSFQFYVTKTKPRRCSCEQYLRNYSLPCPHISIVYLKQGCHVEDLSTLCHTAYWLRLYKSFRDITWDNDEPVNNSTAPHAVALPPATRMPRGRPKKLRKKSHKDMVCRKGKIHRCTRCMGEGHNRRSCKAAIVPVMEGGRLVHRTVANAEATEVDHSSNNDSANPIHVQPLLLAQERHTSPCVEVEIPRRHPVSCPGGNETDSDDYATTDGLFIPLSPNIASPYQ